MNAEATKDTEKVIVLVQKLLALATSSNEHEAASTAAKAQEILLKYNLSMAQVEAAGGEKGESIGRHDIARRGFFTWSDVLMNAVSQANLCRVIKDTSNTSLGSRGRFIIFGKRSSVEVTEYLFSYLYNEIVWLAPKHGGLNFTNAWRLGAANTIGLRLLVELKSFQVTPDTRALVVTNKAALDLAVKKEIGKTSNSSTKIRNRSGFAEGSAAGRDIAIRRGIGATNAAGQSLLA